MQDAKTQATQVAFAWGGVGFTKFLNVIGVHSWADFSAMIVSLYTLALFAMFLWRLFRGRGPKKGVDEYDS